MLETEAEELSEDFGELRTDIDSENAENRVDDQSVDRKELGEISSVPLTNTSQHLQDAETTNIAINKFVTLELTNNFYMAGYLANKLTNKNNCDR